MKKQPFVILYREILGQYLKLKTGNHKIYHWLWIMTRLLYLSQIKAEDYFTAEEELKLLKRWIKLYHQIWNKKRISHGDLCKRLTSILYLLHSCLVQELIMILMIDSQIRQVHSKERKFNLWLNNIMTSKFSSNVWLKLIKICLGVVMGEGI